MLTARRGWSLAELLVAVVLLGIIGAAASNALVQQGRVRTRVVRRLAAEAQMREAMAPLLADLGAASPAAGDFAAGHATDTSIAIRIATAEGFVCALDAADPMTARVVLLSSMRGRSIAAGDSAWSYQGGRWAAAPVQQVAADAAPSPCSPPHSAQGQLVRVALGGTTPPAPGAPLRFTRRVRYSLYRAGDGETHLGLREWSAALAGFTGQQPVAGPLSRAGSGFRYADSLGNAMQPSDVASGRLAQVIIELKGPRLPWESSAASSVLSMTAALRNRR